MDGGHVVDVSGKFFLRLSELSMLLLILLRNGVEAAIQIINLFRQLAQLSAVLHVPLLQCLGVLLFELGDQCRQVCSFVHTSLHISAIP